jgi:tRNA modification GTPase
MVQLIASDAVASVAQESLSACLRLLCDRDVPLAKIHLRSFRTADGTIIDEGLVARLTPEVALLMPHGGLGVLRELEARLQELGCELQSNASSTRIAPQNARALFPEARSTIEALALAALTRAQSPLAVDVLLAQHDAWQDEWPTDEVVAEREHLPQTRDVAIPATCGLEGNCPLAHLLNPPRVVLFGPANVGKSSLLNALASQHVSIIADAPGTTRDHVGAMMNVQGLAVLMVDTPGVRATDDAIEQAARAHAIKLVQEADLVLHCGDAESLLPPLPRAINTQQKVLRVALRADRGLASWPHDIAVGGLQQVATSQSHPALSTLVGRIRETLLPDCWLTKPQAWRFWEV